MAGTSSGRWPGPWQRPCENVRGQPERKDTMKRHSGWLAAGLLLFVVLACNLSKNGNNSNNSNSNSNSNKNSNTSTNTRPANAEVYIDKIRMAKDKNGEPEATAPSTLNPGHSTLHFLINPNKATNCPTAHFSCPPVALSP